MMMLVTPSTLAMSLLDEGSLTSDDRLCTLTFYRIEAAAIIPTVTILLAQTINSGTQTFS